MKSEIGNLKRASFFFYDDLSVRSRVIEIYDTVLYRFCSKE